MQPTHPFRFRLVASCVLILAAALFSGCSARLNHWADTDKGQLLAEKVKTSKYAYLRYDQAEQEARRYGDQEEAEHYRQAKETALADYQRYEKELSDYDAARGIKPMK